MFACAPVSSLKTIDLFMEPDSVQSSDFWILSTQTGRHCHHMMNHIVLHAHFSWTDSTLRSDSFSYSWNTISHTPDIPFSHEFPQFLHNALLCLSALAVLWFFVIGLLSFLLNRDLLTCFMALTDCSSCDFNDFSCWELTSWARQMTIVFANVNSASRRSRALHASLVMPQQPHTIRSRISPSDKCSDSHGFAFVFKSIT